MGYIYKVTNLINQKVYIGKTSETIEQRWKEHILDSKKVDLHRPFYNAIRKYGIQNFSIEKIEEIDNNFLDDREKYWIKYYNSYVGFLNSNGYNATLGGDGTFTYDYQLIVDDYLKTGSKTQTAKNLNCAISTVTNACKSFNIKTINQSGGRKIQQLDPLTKEVINTFDSIKQAAEIIVPNNPTTARKRITTVINHKPNQKAYGFYWRAN